MTNEQARRSGDYRYRVELLGKEITPLASVEAHLGNLKLRILNISSGGVALLLDSDPPLKLGDVGAISISIRERAFPVQIEVKNQNGFILHCAFLDASRAFQSALREFLKPKFLGQSLKRNLPLSARADALELVSGATGYEAFVGQNETAIFVWVTSDRSLLKIFGAAQDLILQWTPSEGLRTGRQKSKSSPIDDITWDRNPDSAIANYFADIFLAWLVNEPQFVEKLFSDEAVEESLKFPLLS